MRAAWLVLVLCVVGIAQTQNPQTLQRKMEQEFEQILGRKPHLEPATGVSPLEQCESQVHDWEDWYNKSIPMHTQLQKDYAQLSDDYYQMSDRNQYLETTLQSNRRRILWGSGGMGLGLGVAFVGLRLLWQWRASSAGKQLAALVLGAAWITVAAFYGAADARLSAHPVNLLLTVFVYSIPALLLAGIGFWWFGKSNAIAEKQA